MLTRNGLVERAGMALTILAVAPVLIWWVDGD